MIETISDNMDNVFELHRTVNNGTSIILIACGIKMKGFPVPIDDNSYYENRYCAFPAPAPTFSTSFYPKYCGNHNIGRATFPI